MVTWACSLLGRRGRGGNLTLANTSGSVIAICLLLLTVEHGGPAKAPATLRLAINSSRPSEKFLSARSLVDRTSGSIRVQVRARPAVSAASSMHVARSSWPGGPLHRRRTTRSTAHRTGIAGPACTAHCCRSCFSVSMSRLNPAVIRRSAKTSVGSISSHVSGNCGRRSDLAGSARAWPGSNILCPLRKRFL